MKKLNNETEWYQRPAVKKAIFVMSQILWLITQPHVMPIWMFCLMYWGGGMSIAYCIVMALIITFVAYKIWKD
mgnify:CR=1 FL=1